MLKIKPRLYQEKIFANSIKKNTLIVLPTGLGKTIIALMLAIYFSKRGKILFLAPTKPLVEQHYKSFLEKSNIEKEDCAVISGDVKPEKRNYREKYIFATPQTIRNDIIARKINLDEFSLIIFDECHKAVGNYAYVFIASQFQGHIIGLTASPGDEEEKIKEICKNLKISNIEFKTENDPDIKPYIKKKEIKKVYINLPENYKLIIKHLKKALSNSLKELKEAEIINTSDINKITKRDLLSLQSQAIRENSFSNLSLIAKAIKAMHALELIQTQGTNALKVYFNNLKKQNSKATKSLLRDLYFQQAIELTNNLNVEHPKFEYLEKIISNEKTYLIFTQYRATAEKIVEFLKNKDIKASIFVGQRGETGMSQKKQLEILNKFRNGEFNVLVSTSISEEGLDIPSIDTAIFFEPVPSALRSVQRKGRVGRAKPGEIYLLITKGTVDEKYYWVSFYKEKRMKKAIKNIDLKGQKKLNEFF